MLGLGLHYDPMTAFSMVGTGLVILIVGVYIVMNLSCIGFFSRSGRLNVLSHVIVPILGIAAFVPAWCAGAGIKIPGFSFITPAARAAVLHGPGGRDLDGASAVSTSSSSTSRTRAGSSTSAWSTSTLRSPKPPALG